jgi:hypothetical protein
MGVQVTSESKQATHVHREHHRSTYQDSEPPIPDTDNLPEAMIKPIASGLPSNDLHPLVATLVPSTRGVQKSLKDIHLLHFRHSHQLIVNASYSEAPRSTHGRY